MATATTESAVSRFFRFDDGGATYWVVATDLEHARRILRGTDIEFDDGLSFDKAMEKGAIVCTELTRERAEALKATDEHDGTTRKLAECDVGSWFSSEY